MKNPKACNLTAQNALGLGTRYSNENSISTFSKKRGHGFNKGLLVLLSQHQKRKCVILFYLFFLTRFNIRIL